MKKILLSLKNISFFSILSFLVLYSNTINSQIRLVEVNPSSNKATIKNFGTSTIDISSYWFCTLFAYDQLSSLTVDSGSLNIANGATVVISGVNLNNSDADLGLYNTNSFGSSTAMVDFMQWGDAGNGRESVANTAGIWTTGNFLAGSGPFIYNGDGSQNGITFWQEGTLSIRDVILNASLSIYPNPVVETLKIKKLQNINLKIASIFDISGRLISSVDLTQTISEKRIALNSITKGIYFIRITDDQGGTIAKKFIKE